MWLVVRRCDLAFVWVLGGGFGVDIRRKFVLFGILGCSFSVWVFGILII